MGTHRVAGMVPPRTRSSVWWALAPPHTCTRWASHTSDYPCGWQLWQLAVPCLCTGFCHGEGAEALGTTRLLPLRLRETGEPCLPPGAATSLAVQSPVDTGRHGNHPLCIWVLCFMLRPESLSSLLGSYMGPSLTQLWGLTCGCQSSLSPSSRGEGVGWVGLPQSPA